MKVNLTVCDEYSGLATLLANLIAKYADMLELEDDAEENQQSAVMNAVDNQSKADTAQGSLSQASLPFCLQIRKQHDIINVKIMSKEHVAQ